MAAFLMVLLELANVLSQLQLPPTVISHLRKMMDSTPAGQVADLLASMIDLTFAEKLQILEMTDVKERLKRVVELVNRQIQVLKISQELQTTVENKIGKTQREYLLRQQVCGGNECRILLQMLINEILFE